MIEPTINPAVPYPRTSSANGLLMEITDEGQAGPGSVAGPRLIRGDLWRLSPTR